MDTVKDFALISNALWEESADLEKALRDFSALDMGTRVRMFGGIMLAGTLPYEDDKRRLLGLMCQRLEGRSPAHTKNLHHIGKRVVESVSRGQPHFRRSEFWMGLVQMFVTDVPNEPHARTQGTALFAAIDRLNS